MSIAYVADVVNAGGSDGGTSSAINTTGANLIVALVNGYGVNFPALSDSKGNTWTGLTRRNTANDDPSARLYYCVNPTVGTGHTFTLAGTDSFSSAQVVAFSGASGGYDVENGSVNAASTSGVTGTLTPTGDNAVLVYGIAPRIANITAVSVGTLANAYDGVSGQTYGGGIGYQIQTTKTARNPSFTISASVVSAGVIAAFKPDAASGPRIYYVVGPNAGWVNPTASEVIAGTLSGGGAATASGNEASPTVTTDPFTFAADATGLTAGENYRIAFVWSDGVDSSAVEVSGVVSTLSGTANATITQAAGTSTAGTLTGQATAAAALTPAAGVSAASALVGSAATSSAITAAAGISTTATLTGKATGEATITAAAGVSTTTALATTATATAAITPAAGVSTAATLTSGSATAASISPAAGVSTASTLAGAATMAAAFTAAAGVSTTGALAGQATAAASITAAGGTSAASTLTGTGLTAGASGIVPAAGASTTSTLTGQATAAAAVTPAAGVSTTSALASTGVVTASMVPAAGASTTSALAGTALTVASASMVPAAGASTASAFAASAVAATVAIASAGASSAQALAGSSQALAAILAAAGVSTTGILVDVNAIVTNSEWWLYVVAADNLSYAVPADDLSFAVTADSLAYRTGV